jgi:iron complex outermembrane recepter protein
MKGSCPSAGGQFPLLFANLMAGHTYGAEAWGNYRVSSAWQLTFGANWLHEVLHFRPGSAELGGVALAGNDPKYQLSMGSTMDLARDWVLNVHLRRIGALPNPSSPAYTEADARIGWSASRAVQLSLTGSNLLHAHHLEFGTAPTPIQLGSTGVESGRSIFVEIRAQF